MPQPSKTLAQLPPYLFREIDRKIDEAKAKGLDVISLGVGDPDLPTPEIVVEALRDAVLDASTHDYPPYQGTTDYRDAVARWMKARFDVEVDIESETLALIGAKEGIAHLIAAYVEPGDVVLCPSPAYPVYNNYTVLVGGEPVTVPLLPENNFLPDLSSIPDDVAARAKLFFLNYPNNPTGALVTEEFMQECIAFCKKHDILLCHDNAYSEMTFEGYKAPSFLSVAGAKDVCIEMFSLSKMYNMTGWRAGFAVGNADALKALGTVKNNVDSGIFKAIQRACIVALDNSEELTKHLNEIYGKRRDIVVEGLKKLGWDFDIPPATFYLWLPVPKGMTSTDFAAMLLDKCTVVVPPGLGYGDAGEGFFRIALTKPEAQLREVLKRMEEQGIRYDTLSQAAAA